MKRMLLFLLIFGNVCACTSSLDDLLTTNNWEVEKVVDYQNGIVKETDENKVKIWNFKLDNTYCYEVSNENENQSIEGEWNLDGYKLLINNEFDSTNVFIEKITCDKMVWLIEGEDSIRFYLSSKVRDVVFSEFPNLSGSNTNNNGN